MNGCKRWRFYDRFKITQIRRDFMAVSRQSDAVLITTSKRHVLHLARVVLGLAIVYYIQDILYLLNFIALDVAMSFTV